MALVAYDYGSDSEGSEDELQGVEDEKDTSILTVEKTTTNDSALSPQTTSKDDNTVHTHATHPPRVSTYETLERTRASSITISSEISDEDEDTFQVSSTSNLSMFDKLPPKKNVIQNKLEMFEDKVEDFIPKAKITKKQREKVRISVPSLSDFDDIKSDEPSSKKSKSSSKGSGLLSLLPPVKCIPISNTSFVPNVLNQRNKTPSEQVKTMNKSLVPDSVRKNKLAIKPKVKSDDSGGSDDDIDLPETFDEELWQKSCGKITKKDIIEEESVVEEPRINLAPEPVQPYAGLDNEAFKELVGKRSRMPRNIKLIDVNEEELVAEKDLWMRKSLTDPDCVPKAPIEDPVDPTKRKKHHITYLAEQAKANEQELQNQWSSSKFNRNQSRAKYGF